MASHHNLLYIFEMIAHLFHVGHGYVPNVLKVSALASTGFGTLNRVQGAQYPKGHLHSELSSDWDATTL